jgi:hypothetical protein
MLNSEQKNFQIFPNSFFYDMIGVNFKITSIDIVSACRKYCIVLDYSQQSCSQA